MSLVSQTDRYDQNTKQFGDGGSRGVRYSRQVGIPDRESPAGHRRKDLTGEAVRFFAVYSYLIAYRGETKPLQIAAILHGRREIQRLSSNIASNQHRA